MPKSSGGKNQNRAGDRAGHKGVDNWGGESRGGERNGNKKKGKRVSGIRNGAEWADRALKKGKMGLGPMKESLYAFIGQSAEGGEGGPG